MSTIHPTAVIDSAAQLADEVVIGPYCVIGPHVSIGSGTEVLGHAFIDGHISLGEGCTVYPFASLGTRTQDKKYAGGEPRVEIGDRTVVREYVTVNAGTDDSSLTKVGNDALLMAYSHVAHNCVVGDHAILVNAATLAGEVVVEDYATVGALTGVHQFTRIGKMSFIGGCSRVTQDVPPFMMGVGNPVEIRGTNAVGLERRGVTKDVRRDLKRSFKALFREGLATQAALEKIEAEFGESSEVQHLVSFIRHSERGIAKS